MRVRFTLHMETHWLYGKCGEKSCKGFEVITLKCCVLLWATETYRIDKQYRLNDAVLQQKWKKLNVCKGVGGRALSPGQMSADLIFRSLTQKLPDSVWRREEDGSLALVWLSYLFQLWSLLLLSSFACGQVLACHGSPGKVQADRRGGSCWALTSPPPPPPFRVCRPEMTKDGGRQGGAAERRERRRRGGRHQRGMEGDGKRRAEPSWKSDSFLLFWI